MLLALGSVVVKFISGPVKFCGIEVVEIVIDGLPSLLDEMGTNDSVSEVNELPVVTVGLSVAWVFTITTVDDVTMLLSLVVSAIKCVLMAELVDSV